jgi:UDP-N-acetylglucosamine:LPS N-acetylglucosamine transferase
MGAGHDGAARELAARLNGAGHDARVKDFLDSGPLHIGAALRSGYEFELKHLPSAYEATYRLWYRVPWLCPVVAWLVTVLTRRRVLRWIRQAGADVVVSTYPLATLCLGRLRQTGRLRLPAVNFITDFGVHPLWVHRGVDINLAVHDGPAQMAARRTKRLAVACGPVVSPRFHPGALPDRAQVRAGLGLQPSDRAVLVVAGSWGVGGVEATCEAIARDGRFTPVVVCGRDEHLRSQVAGLAAARDRAVVLGWTDDMPGLMAACDALVENAGGLTSLEAMQAGLPVVSFRPIAGHGRENTARMATAGVSSLAADPGQLLQALDRLTSDGPVRAAQIAAGQAMFRGDAASLVVDAARSHQLIPMPVLRRPVAVAGRVAVAAVGVAALGWTGLTSGVEMATAAAGAGVAHPAPGLRSVVYVGVRLDGPQLANPAVGRQLAHMDLTAVVDATTAAANPASVHKLVDLGVNVESGGRGVWSTPTGHEIDPTLWTRARGDATAGRTLARLTGDKVSLVVLGRRVNAWDLIECRDAHSSVVVPDDIVTVRSTLPSTAPMHVTPRHIYLINGMGATPAQLAATLARLSAGLAQAGLEAVPLATLA